LHLRFGLGLLGDISCVTALAHAETIYAQYSIVGLSMITLGWHKHLGSGSAPPHDPNVFTVLWVEAMFVRAAECVQQSPRTLK
jgi:hypothetical protein